MQVRCSQCYNPIEIDRDAQLSDISCPVCGSSFSLLGTAETASYETGTRTIGHFKLIDQIGVGTFGFVWKARDIELDRTVAVKIPRKGQLNPDETEQFLREARAAAQLRHANIVSVHEVGRDQDEVFIVSDFVDGVTLADRLTAQQFPCRKAAELCAKIADALHHAHEAGVIHRDLKPGNIKLDAAGEPHIMDFGLARREVGEVTMTVEGRVLGTPAYMSPEQAKGSAHTADRRSDVYSLGVMLYETLTGERPFRGNVRMLVHQVINDDAPSPRRLNGNVPRDLETICLKCLEKEPSKRYATAKRLAEDLRRFVAGEPISARPVARIERGWRWCIRNPRVAVLAAAFIAALALGFSGISWQWARARLETERSRRLLYVSDMNVARQAWEENNVGRVRDLLLRHVPDGSDDLRGFEWYYLWRLWYLADQADSISPPGRARRIAVSQASHRLAVGCGNGVVSLWNLKTMQQELVLRISGSAILPSEPSSRQPNEMPGWEWISVAFSPDGKELAYANADSSGVILQDLKTRTSRPFGGHTAALAAVTFAPNARFLATGSNDGVVILHDLRDNTSSKLIQFKDRVTALAFSTDSDQLAIATGNDVAVFDLTSRVAVSPLKQHTRMVWAVAYSPDGKYLASSSADHTVIIWDLATRVPRVLQGHTDEVRSIAFSADGHLLASGSRDNTASLWDVSTGRRIETFRGHAHNVESVALYGVDERIRLVTGSSDGFVKCWDVGETGSSMLRCESGVLQVAFIPGSRAVCALDTDRRRVRVWTPRSHSWVITEPVTGEELYSIAVSKQRLAVGTKDGIRCWRIADWSEEPRRFHSRTPVTALRFSTDGSLIAAGCKNGRLFVCRADSSIPVRQLEPGHTQYVTSVDFTSNGTVIASGSYDGTVKIWETSTGKLVNPLPPSKEAVMAVAFSHDSRILASGGYDNLVKLWQNWAVPDPVAYGTMSGHTDGIISMTFSHDDRTLITGCGDCTLRVWDVRDRQERFVFLGHASAVQCADQSSDDTLLASGARDGDVRLWRAATPEEVKAAGEWWKR